MEKAKQKTAKQEAAERLYNRLMALDFHGWEVDVYEDEERTPKQVLQDEKREQAIDDATRKIISPMMDRLKKLKSNDTTDQA